MQARLKWTLPKSLTLLGGLILLSSWLVQNSLYDRWDGRRSALDRAEMIYVSLLADTLMMNGAKNPESGTEIFTLGLDYMIRGLPPDDQESWQGKLSATDNNKLNDFGMSLMKEVEEQQKRIDDWRGIARISFIGTYLVGSVLFAFGQLIMD